MQQGIICLDFDGVIHSYVSGWQGTDVIPDPPTKCTRTGIPIQTVITGYQGAGYTVTIISSRSKTAEGRAAIRAWLEKWDFPDKIEISPTKPPAILNIDDRSWPKWEGVFPSVEEIKAFQPWYKHK